MDINKLCRLFLKESYLYDIASCHYTILEKLGFDLSKIDKNDKTKRNIQIGQMMRVNPRLTGVLRGTTNSIVDDYLRYNNIKDSDLILRQYDGIIVTKTLRPIENNIPLELRNQFTSFIISVDRKSYIAFDGFEVIIKGLSHRYEEMDKMLGRIAKIEFSQPSAIFKSLQRIHDEILTSNNVFLYCIPEAETKYNIFLKDYGSIEISKETAKIMDHSDIDKQMYFDFYLKPFIQSIVMEFA